MLNQWHYLPSNLMKTELLSPAGTLKNMHYAFAYGADAVYAGQPRYSLRVRNNDFSQLDKLATGIQTAHDLGKLFFIAANIAPHNVKVKTFMKDIEPVIAMQPDALIMSDPGLIMMVRERFPDMVIHLSVQMNTVNYASVKFWQTMGVKRIILSRELSLDEVAEIRQECPDIELEMFIHGALCIAYSGRCLLSGYFNHRDANQGSCTNACRWDYNVVEGEEDIAGNIQPKEKKEKIYLVEEKQRKGEYMPIIEDEHGSYIMNSKDLRAVQHVQQLVDIGIDSLKIEGRTKSHYYAARSTQVYREAIDDALAGKEFNTDLMSQLDNLANRGYTEGFYRRHLPEDYQNYEQGSSTATQQQFVGEVLEYDNDKQWLKIEAKNRFSVGDQLELMLPSGNQRFVLEQMFDTDGNPMEVAKGSSYTVWIHCPLKESSHLGLLMRDLVEQATT